MRTPTFLFSFLSLIFLFAFAGCQSSTQNQDVKEEIVDFPVSTKSEEAKAAVLKGLDIWDMGNGQKAHAYFAKALEKDPNLAIAHVFAGATAGSAEAFGSGLAKAKANLTGASDFEKQMIDYLETFAKNDTEARLAIAKKMAEENPNISRCQINLGDTYWARKEVELSRDSYQKAITIDPKSPLGYLSLANSNLFAEPKDLAKAESNASKVVELAAENPRAHIILGDCYRGQNKLEQARDSYTKAIQVGAEDYEPYYKKGHANTFLGNYEEARTDFQNGRKYDDDKDVTFEALTYLYSGDPKTALNWLEEKVANIGSLGISPERIVDSKLNMLDDCAWIAFHQGDAAKLQALKDQILPLSEEEAKGVGSSEALIQHEGEMLFWDALIAASKGNTKDANSKLAEIKTKLEPIKNSRKLEGYYFANGYVNMKKKDYKGAIAGFEKCNLDWIYNQYWLAKANEMAGNREKAYELYKKAASDNFNSVHNANIRNEVKEKVKTI